jgi:hypothetical protein
MQRYRVVPDLPNRVCQWHGGRTDDEGWLVFCGEPVFGESSYCPDHHRRVYQRVTLSAAATAAAAAAAAAMAAANDESAALEVAAEVAGEDAEEREAA